MTSSPDLLAEVRETLRSAEIELGSSKMDPLGIVSWDNKDDVVL